jgi:hypothetical protein
VTLEIVEMRKVHDEIGPMTDFLEAHVKGSIKVKGSRIIVDGADHSSLKMLVHKYLHQKGLVGYKVHSQPGLIEIVPHDEKAAHDKSKGTAPSATETMPYFFPGR